MFQTHKCGSDFQPMLWLESLTRLFALRRPLLLVQTQVAQQVLQDLMGRPGHNHVPAGQRRGRLGWVIVLRGGTRRAGAAVNNITIIILILIVNVTKMRNVKCGHFILILQTVAVLPVFIIIVILLCLHQCDGCEFEESLPVHSRQLRAAFMPSGGSILPSCWTNSHQPDKHGRCSETHRFAHKHQLRRHLHAHTSFKLSAVPAQAEMRKKTSGMCSRERERERSQTPPTTLTFIKQLKNL